MRIRGNAGLAVVLAAMTAVPAGAQHIVTADEAAAEVRQATVSARQDLATVQSFLSDQGADPGLARRLDTNELADVAEEIRAQQQQQQKGASTGVYMLAGAGVLLILLLIIGLAVGSSE